MTVGEKIQEFFSAYPTRSYDKGSILIQGGSDPAGIFYLVEGRVIQYDILPSGNSIVVNSFKPLAFFPMSWAINRTANDYFFEAATAVKTRITHADKAVAFLKDNPDVLFDLLARVYKGTDGILRRTVHLMGGSARSRVLFELVNTGLRFGESFDDKSVALGINETSLAKHVGLARESVNRELKSLKSDGLININNRHGIVINDFEQVKQLLGEL